MCTPTKDLLKGSTTRVAVATSNGTRIDLHFNQAEAFLVYDVAEDGAYVLVDRRNVASGVGGEETSVSAAALLLGDVSAVLAARVGPGAAAALSERGIKAFSAPGELDRALRAYGVRGKLLADVLPTAPGGGCRPGDPSAGGCRGGCR